MRLRIENDFAAATSSASANKPKRKRSPTVGMRVSEEEKAILERAAGKRSLNAYLRERIFGDDAMLTSKPRRSRGQKPVQDGEALGRVLAALGRSGIPDALDRLIAAQQHRPIPNSDAELVQACADIAAMKTCLLQALGLKIERGAQR